MAAAGDAQLPEKPLAHGMAAARHPLDDRIPFPEPEDSALDEALRRLTPKYRAAVHFILLRGLHAEEITRMSGEKNRPRYAHADARTDTAARIDERRTGRWIFTSSTAT